MKALIKTEGAGFTVELIGDDCPVQKYFVSDIVFVHSFKFSEMVKGLNEGDTNLESLSPAELELLRGAKEVS